ncbi:unnamed protein product [Sphagnum troendelagicum]|uniref:Uncharacterized protein n=1 Tax=Sphagnum troendelagicum TaxID=128251 RepID=A0ABP0U0R0_9BRYO
MTSSFCTRSVVTISRLWKHLKLLIVFNVNVSLGVLTLLALSGFMFSFSRKVPMLAAVNWLFTLLLFEKSAWLNLFRGCRLSLQHVDKDISFALKI